ncbi:stress protein [Streptomyces venezuelae]|uniref:Stress protein n=1 Tax=Streptomyces venezuelae TaxID=54571 RepID=A0A5P2CWJ4_STRVZ|nr:TerD family protein [Streptomyces venezuelae]QES47272.1 stress protein [Streptomyces venezuelae]
MASDQLRWWRDAPGMSPDEALVLETAAGQDQRFAELDGMAARLLEAALNGQPMARVTQGRGPQASDTVELVGLAPQERLLYTDVFGVQEQQRRGAWYLPQKLSLKAGVVNLPHLMRRRAAHAMTVAADDTARISTVDSADAVLLWALLNPLFETVMEPVRVRAAGPVGSAEDQQQLWDEIESRFARLGLAPDVLARFRFGAGWHRLDRAAQQRARLELLDSLAVGDLSQLVARHRMTQVQSLMEGFTKKAKSAKIGTALARRVLTRALQPVVSGYFSGDWLAVLDYLQVSPHPDEEVITTLPEPRLYVGMSSQAATMAAESGVAEEEIHAVLTAFLGGTSSLSPVEERGDTLREWWVAFDQAHAVQAPGMRSLWGLVDEELMTQSGNDQGSTPQLYRDILPAAVNERVDRLWDTMTLQRHSRSIVSNPRPHQLMADTFGPAVEFWHGVALTAWFVCEGPSSRTSLSGVADYYRHSLAALQTAGCPVDPSLFEELRTAERHLGPEEMITRDEGFSVGTPFGDVTVSSSIGYSTRREGFERVRDIVTRHRRAWAEEHLATYLQQRWRTELEDVARAHHRFVAAKGRPPTLIQFAQFATTAANRWTGGDLGAVYTAIGEPAAAEQQRPTRLLTCDGYDFARRVYEALGGKPLAHDTWMNDPDESRRQWQLSRLATESLRYLQLHEALGEPPTAKQFGAQRIAWPWPGEEAEGWPIFQSAISALTDTSPPVAAGQTAGDLPAVREEKLAKGGNSPLRTAPVTVRIIATGAPVDVSAVLLATNGKVRNDNDLVFYNHPHQDGVRADGDTVTAVLGNVPDDVRSIAVVVSIDLEARPTAVFDQHTTWRAEATQLSQNLLSFQPEPFASGETVTVAMELYRHSGGWKARAVGQGYDTGLAGLATDYGIDVEA